MEANSLQIEAIFFDIGGVLWQPPDTPLSATWAKRCGLDAAMFDKLVYASKWGEQALRGDVTSEQMWVSIGKSLNLSPDDLRELEQDYWKGHWNIPLLDHLKVLKPYYKLGIISDAESNARAMVKEWVNEELFDVLVFSAEEKVCKPDPRIFTIALQKLGVSASSTLFVDDKTKNVEGAKQLGIHAVLYEDLPRLLNILNTYTSSTVKAKA